MSDVMIRNLDEYCAVLARDAAYGEQQAAQVGRVLRDSRFGACVLFTPDGEAADAPVPLRGLYGLLSRQQPVTLLGEGLRVALDAALGRLPLRPGPAVEGAARAPVNAPGVVRAAGSMGAVARRYAGEVVLPFRLDELLGLVSAVSLGQGAHNALGRLAKRAWDNLGVWETRLLFIVREHYPYLEALAGADEDLVDELEPTRVYLKGPAQQGAQKRKENEKQLDRLTTQAQKEGQAEARTGAWSSILDEFRSFVDGQARRQPESDVPAGRRTPR